MGNISKFAGFINRAVDAKPADNVIVFAHLDSRVVRVYVRDGAWWFGSADPCGREILGQKLTDYDVQGLIWSPGW